MSLTIVGGVYAERTTFPASEVIYGSGGRAAAALGRLDPGRKLVTCVGANARGQVEYHVKKVWSIEDVRMFPAPEIVSFSYRHGLSNPRILPTRLPFSGLECEVIEDQKILQFGMLEGPVVVHGERVIFDPQNPESPETFSAHGSTAASLAYVLNATEVRRLAGRDDLREACRVLQENEEAAVVVVKRGPLGVLVCGEAGFAEVPAYETPRVYPIGSGDVFAAVFAEAWATRGMEAAEAARHASRAAAKYCATSALPIPEDFFEAEQKEFPKVEVNRTPSESLVYLAGPFFTMAELWLVEEARDALTKASSFHGSRRWRW